MTDRAGHSPGVRLSYPSCVRYRRVLVAVSTAAMVSVSTLSISVMERLTVMMAVMKLTALTATNISTSSTVARWRVLDTEAMAMEDILSLPTVNGQLRDLLVPTLCYR